ncbi:hypothetical protein [Xylophilus ampelinus]|nr:hypothetical protein [Xylophilus ampelinus]MCS4509337.1 hypothetical protein [Xylophilus ampelinus]
MSVLPAAFALPVRGSYRAAGLLALACATAAVGAPAPWYQWRSLQNGTRVCAQTSPGSGWTRVGGPFRDVNCSLPLRVIGL